MQRERVKIQEGQSQTEIAQKLHQSKEIKDVKHKLKLKYEQKMAAAVQETEELKNRLKQYEDTFQLERTKDVKILQEMAQKMEVLQAQNSQFRKGEVQN